VAVSSFINEESGFTACVAFPLFLFTQRCCLPIIPIPINIINIIYNKCVSVPSGAGAGGSVGGLGLRLFATLLNALLYFSYSVMSCVYTIEMHYTLIFRSAWFSKPSITPRALIRGTTVKKQLKQRSVNSCLKPRDQKGQAKRVRAEMACVQGITGVQVQ